MATRAIPACLLLVACGAGGEYHAASGPPASSYVASFDGRQAPVVLGAMRLRPGVCAGVETKPDFRPLDADAFIDFLKQRGFTTRLIAARADLVYVDVSGLGTPSPVRFRVAILDAPGAAGHELHEALLQHGEGSWGAHRANLAVLAPNAPLEDVVGLAARTKLACWGVLTVAGHDDTYVLPGGYAEL